MNCKLCNSSYTHFVKVDGDFDKEIHIYHCDSCNRNFEVQVQTVNNNAEWIMTLSGGFTRNGKPDNFAKIMKEPGGTIICFQKATNQYGKSRFNTYKVSPKFKVEYTRNGFHGYHLWYSSYLWPNDPNGTTFIVDKVEYGPALIDAAKRVEALRILARPDYLKQRSINDPTVLKDAASYLASAVAPPRTNSNTTDASSDNTGTSGCYVATCVYGSYDCPEVWTLRRFRDNTLAETWYGCAFIRTYYTISPTLVKWFGKTEWFKKLWRPPLDCLVKKLNQIGIEDSAYNDKIY